MATLLQIRTALNGEIGVLTDAEAAPWPVAVRNQAIADAYAALWTRGVWKTVTQDIASIDDEFAYPLTSIRHLRRLELIDSSVVVGLPKGTVEGNGAGAWQLRVVNAIDEGFTIRVSGYAPYVSTFANDAAVDDLPAEYARIPRLKAKAILYRQQLGMFARYGERQAAPPVMNVTVDQLVGIIAAAEREFEDEAKALARLRPRVGQPRTL